MIKNSSKSWSVGKYWFWKCSYFCWIHTDRDEMYSLHECDEKHLRWANRKVGRCRIQGLRKGQKMACAKLPQSMPSASLLLCSFIKVTPLSVARFSLLCRGPSQNQNSTQWVTLFGLWAALIPVILIDYGFPTRGAEFKLEEKSDLSSHLWVLQHLSVPALFLFGVMWPLPKVETFAWSYFLCIINFWTWRLFLA